MLLSINDLIQAELESFNSSSQSKISDPVNLNPAQSSSLLKNVIDGKLDSNGKCQHLQVETQNIQENSQKNPSRKESRCEGKNSVQNFSSQVLKSNPVQEKSMQKNPSRQYTVDEGENLDQNFCNPVLPPFPAQELMKSQDTDPFKSKKESFPSSIEKLLLIQEKMYEPKFRFDVSVESAKFNFMLLKENKFDLKKKNY